MEQARKNLRKLHNEELRGYYSLNVFIMIKMRRIKWVWRCTYEGEERFMQSFDK
jgi:hypothetical protein